MSMVGGRLLRKGGGCHNDMCEEMDAVTESDVQRLCKRISKHVVTSASSCEAARADHGHERNRLRLIIGV